jgi:hypothetical protein
MTRDEFKAKLELQNWAQNEIGAALQGWDESQLDIAKAAPKPIPKPKHAFYVNVIVNEGLVFFASYGTFMEALHGVLGQWMDDWDCAETYLFQDITGAVQATLIRDAMTAEIGHLVTSSGIVRHFHSWYETDSEYADEVESWTVRVDFHGERISSPHRIRKAQT